MGLLVIAFLAGLIAGVSPCILPVLPVVFVAWSSPVDDEVNQVSLRRRRAVTVVAGLVLSFSLLTLLGSAILTWLGLPLTFLRDLGIVLLVLLGIGLVVPPIGHLLERPFARFANHVPKGSGSGFVLGLSLGAVFVPCAGPVLTAVTVIGATHKVGVFSLVLTAVFALGAAIPLMIVALAGERLVERNRSLRSKAAKLRPLAGALLIVMAMIIGFNWANGLQRWLPGYTNSLQTAIEQNSYTLNQLHSLEGEGGKGTTLSSCAPSSPILQECGAAPAFTGILSWFNTSNDKPLTLAQLHGKVVLVDFWTYSCINCQRTLPHVEAWWARYRADGLVVVGVHSPEFAFEHVPSNVMAAARSLGVTYPVAIDSNLATWTAYNNEYWPAEYLIDANGIVRHEDFGEGSYPQSESLIRQLLVAAHPGLVLPPPTDVPDKTPTEAISPETYLGSDRAQYDESQALIQGSQSYSLPSSVPLGSFALGGTWNQSSEKITSGASATLGLHYRAQHVYLVLGGSGTVAVSVNGVPVKTISVTGVPTLYQLASSELPISGSMTLTFSPGVDAYDFTFG
jgi:cytochrome c biogenesis protein CcdA/thiol-disulfide isomerase/thioredoxin